MEKEKEEEEEEEDLEEKSMDSTADDEEEEAEKPTTCPTILKTGARKGKTCGRSISFKDGHCGLHTKEKEKGEKVESGASDLRKLEVVEWGKGVYVRNVVGSSKDKGAWKVFWEKHTKLVFPTTCRAKDCEKKATCTGHMYLRDDDRKFNYLLPICSHHNSEAYNINYFLLKKNCVVVKIYERVYFE